MVLPNFPHQACTQQLDSRRMNIEDLLELLSGQLAGDSPEDSQARAIIIGRVTTIERNGLAPIRILRHATSLNLEDRTRSLPACSLGARRPWWVTMPSRVGRSHYFLSLSKDDDPEIRFDRQAKAEHGKLR
jgi:hypothetical protein